MGLRDKKGQITPEQCPPRDRLVKTEDIHPPKTGISVHFCVLSLMAMQN